MLKKIIQTLVRVNTRIRRDQSEFIKKEVKKSKPSVTEGEMFRSIVDFYMINHK